MSTTIAFDIEVAGLPWDEVDESTQNYLLKRAKTPEEREEVPERNALVPGLGKVIAIGLWNLEHDSGMLLLEGESAEPQAWDQMPGSEIMRGSEKELLEFFWAVVARKRPRLVTFNGRSYDGPMLMIRSAQLGVRPSMQLVPYRYDISQHCDLMDVLGFQGAQRSSYSLDYWCHRFDVESPKTSIDGSQVTNAYREGRIEEIGAYCLRDVRATGQLYDKLKPTILPLFKGGPA